ncbi:MAG: hypothetical protein LC777_03050, partial [Actinobacteria bacterium]|nr:hypothetical protein [Actinomycetota bacterium]
MSTATQPVLVGVPRAKRRRPSPEITALARIEGRRLLGHPVFVIGVLLSIALVGAYWLRGTDERTTGMLLGGYALLPLAAATAVAANLVALRSRRDNTDELYNSLPRPRCTRTAGQLLALAWTLPVCGVLLIGTYLALHAQNPPFDLPPAPFREPALIELAQGPLVVIMLGAAGILMARIAPSPIVVALLVIAGFFVEYWLTFWIVGSQ